MLNLEVRIFEIEVSLDAASHLIAQVTLVSET